MSDYTSKHGQALEEATMQRAKTIASVADDVPGLGSKFAKCEKVILVAFRRTSD